MISIIRIYLFLLILIANIFHSDSLAVMSIDFGGEFMKIAIVKPGIPMEIVLNKESQRKTASIISIRKDERTFGEPAMNAGIRFPKTAYRYLIDLIGKDFDNPVVKEYIKRFPYYDILKDPDNNGVLFKNEDGELYSPEELIAMILQKAKEYAEAFTEQSITEAVITVPIFFNQAERRAMKRAGELAGLKILQLLNDNTAVALNYGVFRSKNFNSTSQYYMFFDMGALSSTATIVEYQVVKTKSPKTGITDTFPQLTIRGVGYDRSLGGLEFQLRLRNFLVTLFDKTKKTKKNIVDDPRAMQKLLKEAGRLKQVLSANIDHFAQVEGLFEDEDFRAKVTREEFENLCLDLFDRIENVVKDALTSSAITMEEISEVILMGGGTRMPKIQETLKKIIGREELGKGINTDEAAALGAVYQAANLGKGFKVKKFNIKDTVLFPIEVEFERVKSEGDELVDNSLSKYIHRTLFSRMQNYPQKKVLTFNKHMKDFDFKIGYTDLKFLNEIAIKEIGSLEISKISLLGVDESFSKQPNGVISKGIKAHFHMDESGILYLDSVESLFENPEAIEEDIASESTLSKLGKKFTNFFSGGDNDAQPVGDDVKDETQTDEKSQNQNDFKETNESENKMENGQEKSDESVGDESESEAKDKQSESDEKLNSELPKSGQSDDPELQDSKSNKFKSDESEGSNDESYTEAGKNDTKKEKIKLENNNTDSKISNKKTITKTIKEEIKITVSLKDFVDPQKDSIKKIKNRILEFQKKDEEKNMLEKVKNEIETIIFDTRDKLNEKDFIECSTEEERVKILDALSAADDWMLEQTDATERKSFDEQLAKLKTSLTDLFWRVEEMRNRPEAIRILNERLNYTKYFFDGMKNFTGEDQPFSTTDVDSLAKILTEVTEWNLTKTEAQRKASLTEKPKFTIEDVGSKVALLDREVKYLIGKIKSFKPKTKSPPIKKVKVKTPKELNDTDGNFTDSFWKIDDKIDDVNEKLEKDLGESDTPVYVDDGNDSSPTTSEESTDSTTKQKAQSDTKKKSDDEL